MYIYRLYDKSTSTYVTSGNGKTHWSSIGSIKTMWKTSISLKFRHNEEDLVVQKFECKHIEDIPLEEPT